MNLEKLKPWNWFKHEDHSSAQIPLTKSEVSNQDSFKGEVATAPVNATSSLLQLHREMDRLFDDVWRSFGVSARAPSSLLGRNVIDSPLLGDYRASLDIAGNDKEYEVSIDVPGLSENDINIELRGNVLLVKGEKEESSENKDKQFYRVERSYGAFQRTLTLPDDADTSDIVAKMKNGVLAIRVPRKALPEEDVKRINISS